MQVVRFDQLLNHVLINLPVSCGEGIIKDALRSAAATLCDECEIWRQELTAVNAVANQKSYTLDPQFSAGIKRVYSVYSRTSTEVTAGDKGTKLSLDDAEWIPSTSTIKWTTAPASVAVTNGLVFTVILVPDFKSNEIAGWVLDRWAPGIIAGAVSDICGRPGPQFNADASARYGAQFQNAKADACRELLAEYKDGSVIIEPGWRLT